jgi:methylated-DNA-protein-cysteine methyltransferase-like protein
MDRNFQIIKQVQQIPRGKVASYGQIAAIIPGVTARMVGWALARCGEEEKVPWQRVVNSKGGISPRPGGAVERQILLLKAEGVTFTPKNTINMNKYRWNHEC